MTSLARKLRRAKFGGKESSRPQHTIVEETGYRVLHPTRGYRRISFKRAALF